MFSIFTRCEPGIMAQQTGLGNGAHYYVFRSNYSELRYLYSNIIQYLKESAFQIHHSIRNT